MRAGQLNRRVSIRSPNSTARSADGEPITTWTTVLDTVWADRRPVTADEMFRQDVRWSETTMRYFLRYSTAVNSECILIDLDDSSAEYDIKAVINMYDANSGLEILAERRV